MVMLACLQVSATKSMPPTSASMLGLASSGMIVEALRIVLALSKVSVLMRASLICSGVASGTRVSPVLLPGRVLASTVVGAGDPLAGRSDTAGFLGGTDIVYSCFQGL